MRRIDCEDDIRDGLDYLAAKDPVIAHMRSCVDQVPLRRRPPGFFALADIVISQQVSKQSAEAISARFATLINPMTPQQYLASGEEAWIAIGLSRPKQRTLAALSQTLVNGDIDLDQLCALPVDEATAQMTAIKGIGPWTAQVYLLFAAGHRDIFPAGDLALQEAVRQALDLPERPSEKELRKRAESWAPWRGVAARLAWAYYAAQTGRAAVP